jgi:hypothetical protein
MKYIKKERINHLRNHQREESAEEIVKKKKETAQNIATSKKNQI